MNRGMKILFVAMSNSIHTTRWISQISDQGWDIHLFPSIDVGRIHSGLRDITVHETFYASQDYHNVDPSVKLRGIPVPNYNWVRRGKKLFKQNNLFYRIDHLKKVIKKIRPDIIHSMEIQHAGYLTADVYQQFKSENPPPWIVSNWGSDIYLFGRLPDHVERINNVLSSCDYYHCECKRDVALAKEFGFKGEVLPVFPVAGGFDVKWMRSLKTKQGMFLCKQNQQTSDRRVIALKGYQDWAGRALVGLRAIELCADILKGYKVIVYLPSEDVKMAVRLVSQSTGIEFEFESDNWGHEEILRMHGSARLSIGLSISDAISTSLLEAMIMGSFPIQSNTGSGDEWINDGENGILVEPNSPEDIASAIRSALVDDEMVNKAAEINVKLAEERLDISVLKPKIIEIYENVARENS